MIGQDTKELIEKLLLETIPLAGIAFSDWCLRKMATKLLSRSMNSYVITAHIYPLSFLIQDYLFTDNCAACHLNGGSIVRHGNNLKEKALKKHGMDSVESISQLATNGKNAMSAYKDWLAEKQILDVSPYVLEQAQTGW